MNIAVLGTGTVGRTIAGKLSELGHEVVVPITAGRLDLGPWQRVFYGEWDGQRRKRVIIKVLGEA